MPNARHQQRSASQYRPTHPVHGPYGPPKSGQQQHGTAQTQPGAGSEGRPTWGPAGNRQHDEYPSPMAPWSKSAARRSFRRSASPAAPPPRQRSPAPCTSTWRTAARGKALLRQRAAHMPVVKQVEHGCRCGQPQPARHRLPRRKKFRHGIKTNAQRCHRAPGRPRRGRARPPGVISSIALFTMRMEIRLAATTISSISTPTVASSQRRPGRPRRASL